jgi:ABC-type nitrate/sulfonate/bicarbonate transport system permease component
MSKRSSSAVKLGLEIAVPILILAWWQAVTMHADSRRFTTPLHAISLFPDIVGQLQPSLQRIALGFLIAVFAGIVIGIPLGLWRPARLAATPHVEFWRNIPPTAVLPIFIILTHSIGDVQKVSFIAFFCLFPVLLNTIDAVRGMEPTMLDTARSFNVPWYERVLRVVLPAAVPQIVAGMRNALALAVILMVLSEYFSSTSGIGYVLLNSKNTLQYDEMWSSILMIGLVGYVLNVLFLMLERRLLVWHRGWRSATPL